MNRSRFSFVFSGFLSAIFVASAAGAADVSVNCGAKKNNSINAALAQLAKGGPNTVRVSGTCNEAVAIDGFDRLTLLGNPTATINDPTPDQGPDFEDTAVVRVSDSDRVVIQGISVNGGFQGIVCQSFSICRIQDVHVQGALNTGVQFARSSGFVSGNTVIEGNGVGLGVANGSNVSVFPSSDGLSIPVVRNNSGTGANVVDHSHLSVTASIEDNGGDGIALERSCNLRLFDAIVTGNGGRGLFLRASTARILLATMTGNSGNGVEAAHLSLVRFTETNTIVGNGSPDVNCTSATAVTIGVAGTGGGTTSCTEPAP